MEYHLISATMPTTFEVEINGHLRHGWELHGPTFVDPHNGSLCQAVVKRNRQKTAKTLLKSLTEQEEAA